MVTAERARAALDYDPLTGKFRWREGGRRKVKGALAGTPHREGYNHISLDGKKYLAHRLAWLIMTGSWPEFEIDHKDTNKGNDSWENLRPATHVQNLQNQRIRKNNTTGVKGTSRRANGRFTAQLRSKHLGTFATLAEAAAAYASAVDPVYGRTA